LSGVLDILRAPIYASSRWKDGAIKSEESQEIGDGEKAVP